MFSILFADDTSVFTEHTNLAELSDLLNIEDITSDNKEVVLNNELQHVHSWLSANRLTLNVKKTKYTLFRKHKNSDIGELNLGIYNDAIQSVNEFNFLDLYINSKLNWDTHTKIIGKQVSRAVVIILKMYLKKVLSPRHGGNLKLLQFTRKAQEVNPQTADK